MLGRNNMLRFLAYAVFFLLPLMAIAESFSYAIYSLPLFFGERDTIAEGTRVYSDDDIQVESGPASNVQNWTKTLSVSHGFSIGASVYREPKIDGFGLWMRKNGKGFSWEWFVLEEGNVFRKLQGTGRVKVRLNSVGGEVELASIEFLDDVTFRLDTLWLIPWDKDTHHLIVKKGGVLQFPP